MKVLSMTRLMPHIYLILTVLLLGNTALGDYVSISGSGDSFELGSGELNILSSDSNEFSMSDLDILAATLQGDGIDTVGKLSFMLASTDAGLSFIGLFDGVPLNNPNGAISDHFLGLSTTTSVGTGWYASAQDGTQTDWYDLGNNTQMVNSMLAWDHGQTSAGFAWGDAEQASAGTFNLYDLDLTQFGAEPIQFVTYQDDHWEVAGTAGFSVLGQYAFSYQFVPAPGALALLACAGLISGRFRRRI